MTELSVMVAIFKRNGDKVEVIPTEYNGYWVEVENAFGQKQRFIFNSNGQYLNMCSI